MSKSFGFICVTSLLLVLCLSCQDEQDMVVLPTREIDSVIVSTGEVSDITFCTTVISGEVNCAEYIIAQSEFGLLLSSSIESLNSTKLVIKQFSQDFSYQITLSELDSLTTYYYCNYLFYKGCYYYGDTLSFKTLKPDDIIITGGLQEDLCTVISRIESPSLLNYISQVGVCYGGNEFPTIGDYVVIADSMDNEKHFNVKLFDLPFDTLYYYRAFIKINNSYYYGTTIKTVGNEVYTGVVDTILYQIKSSVRIVDGFSKYGVCYSTSDEPSVSKRPSSNDNIVYAQGMEAGNSFTIKLNHIPFGRVYYRSFVIKDEFVYYGETRFFEGNSIKTGDYNKDNNTVASIIKISTGYDNPEIGICYGLNKEPTITDQKITDNLIETINEYLFQMIAPPIGTVYYRSFIMLYGTPFYGDIKSFVIKPTWVNLGLSVNWATCNMGSSDPSDCGYYYQWGVSENNTGYGEYTYKWYHRSSNARTKYNSNSDMGYNGFVDGKTVLDPEDDVAHVLWGGEWRMPASEEFEELINNCKWTWVNQNGFGYIVTSNKNGNSIFLPAAGLYYNNSSTPSGGLGGYYWSRDIGMNELYFDHEQQRINSTALHNGLLVRPVIPSDDWINNLSVSFIESAVNLPIDGTYKLSVSIKDGNNDANYFVTTWTSNNPSIVSVDENGFIWARGYGTAMITAECKGNTADCTVTVVEPIKESVDLGLSVKWATCNVGALSPEKYGNYYSYGETEVRNSFSWVSYKWSESNEKTLTKYCYNSSYGYNQFVDNKMILDLEDDVAHIKWGGGWRMPTCEELTELLEECSWSWTSQNGVNGYLITGNKTGFTDNSIFLPACGTFSKYSGEGENGYYRSSSLNEENPASGVFIYFNTSKYELGYYYGDQRSFGGRANGYSVRPVCP